MYSRTCNSFLEELNPFCMESLEESQTPNISYKILKKARGKNYKKCNPLVQHVSTVAGTYKISIESNVDIKSTHVSLRSESREMKERDYAFSLSIDEPYQYKGSSRGPTSRTHHYSPEKKENDLKTNITALSIPKHDNPNEFYIQCHRKTLKVKSVYRLTVRVDAENYRFPDLVLYFYPSNRNDINSIFPELIRVSGDITYIPTRTENVYVVLNELDPDVCFPLPTNPPTTEYYESNLKTLTNLHKLKIPLDNFLKNISHKLSTQPDFGFESISTDFVLEDETFFGEFILPSTQPQPGISQIPWSL